MVNKGKGGEIHVSWKEVAVLGQNNTIIQQNIQRLRLLGKIQSGPTFIATGFLSRDLINLPWFFHHPLQGLELVKDMSIVPSVVHIVLNSHSYCFSLSIQEQNLMIVIFLRCKHRLQVVIFCLFVYKEFISTWKTYNCFLFNTFFNKNANPICYLKMPRYRMI